MMGFKDRNFAPLPSDVSLEELVPPAFTAARASAASSSGVRGAAGCLRSPLSAACSGRCPAPASVVRPATAEGRR